MIKLIALDLDGTIVNEDLEVSARTLRVLERVQTELDIKVVIATGRMFPSTVPFAHKLNLQGPVISYQGAMIRDLSVPKDNILEHPILYHQTLDMDITRALIDYIHDNGYHANMYVEDALYTTHINADSGHYAKLSGVHPQSAPNLHEVLTAPPSKLMIIDPKAEQITAHLREVFPIGLSSCRSRHNFCEVVHDQVSKWDALQFLIRQWGLSPQEVMAIGDQENDLSMIEGAGIGVAMGTAPDFVKARANVVTGSIEEDGAAQAIERVVFGHLPLKDLEISAS